MNKEKFYQSLKNRLKNFDKSEAKSIIEYFDEIIDEKMENGYTEEEAISSLGNVDDIIRAIKTDLVIKRSSDKKTNSLRNFLIILGICSSPILIPIGVAFFITFFSLLISLFSVFIALAVSSFACYFAAIVTAIGMFLKSIDLGIILLVFGGAILAGSILGLLSISLYKVSKVILHVINNLYSKLIKKVIRKREIEYA